VAVSLNELASALRAQGRLEEAEQTYRQALALRREVLAPGHPHVAYSLVGLAELLIERGHQAAAEPLLTEGLQIRLAALPADHFLIAETRSRLGRCLAQLGRLEEARPLLVAGHDRLQALFGPEDRRTREAAERLAAVAPADVTRPPGDITALLLQLDGSGQNAVDRIFPYVYEHLKAIARRRLRAEREGHTLSATALVHEAYFKLVDQERVDWRNRAHFFAVAARAMRRILIDHAIARKAEKRGGGQPFVTLMEDTAGGLERISSSPSTRHSPVSGSWMHARSELSSCGSSLA
jgi:tetratricopeptide (TPR) repeat protein